MELQQKIESLNEKQMEILDGYRFYYDGSVRTATITESLETGWCIQAAPVPGLAALIQASFPECKYLKTEDLRAAISLRDKAFEFVRHVREDRQLSRVEVNL